MQLNRHLPDKVIGDNNVISNFAFLQFSNSYVRTVSSERRLAGIQRQSIRNLQTTIILKRIKQSIPLPSRHTYVINKEQKKIQKWNLN